jgi:hypothetical protein
LATHLTGSLREQTSAAFESAAASAGIVERCYRIGGHILLLRCAGEDLFAVLDAAFHHLACPTLSDAELTVLAWDADNGTAFPAAPSSTRAQPWSASISFLEFDPTDETSAGPPWRRVTGQIDVDTAVYWAADPADLRIYDRGAPLLSVVQRWLSRNDVWVVHGGAVATLAGAALIVGGGGSGKSTTTLACRRSGLEFLGDDFVAINLDPPQVHSIYCSAKLNWRHPTSVAKGLQPANGNRLSDEKALYFFAEQAATVEPIRVIIAPRVVVGSISRLSPISAGRALAALGPSSVLQLPGEAGRRLGDLRRLCSQVPSFELQLGADLDAIGDLVAQAIGS